MRLRVALAALLSLAALGVQTSPAHAEIDASGTRLSIAGSSPRFYMTYGRVQDTELYAPVMQILRRAGVTFEREGEDYIVLVRNQRKARWAIVRSRDEVPETGEPCVLELGGQTYVPLKAISEMAKLTILQRGSNQVALEPQGSLNPAAQQRVDLKGVTLTGVEAEQKGTTWHLRIRASGAVETKTLRVTSDNNPRLCLDFKRARWAGKLPLPDPAGDLRGVRVGYPDASTARLTVMVPGPEFSITSLRVEKDEILATIGRGALVRVAKYSPTAVEDLEIRRALEERKEFTGVASGRNLEDPDGTNTPGGGIRIPSERPRPEIPSPDAFNPVASLQGRTIVVDAGHGGHHAGAKGLYNLEKELCLKMALELQDALRNRGANVVMTRTSDVFVSLDARCQIANRSGADIFISIHCNSMPRRNMQSGTETYWHSSEQSRRLARALHPRVVQTVRGRDGGIRNRSFQVIRETHMPSVLLEIAYINNTQDEQLLATPSFHGSLAENIARGVMDYFGTDAR